MHKLISGRFLFTIVTAFVFAHLSINGFLAPDKVTEIIMIIIVFYFNRPDRGETNVNQ